MVRGNISDLARLQLGSSTSSSNLLEGLSPLQEGFGDTREFAVIQNNISSTSFYDILKTKSVSYTHLTLPTIYSV